MLPSHEDSWASVAGLAGALLWALLAALAGAQRAPLGTIELALLAAPLVVVPLGLELARNVSPSDWPALEQAARRLQPFAAIFLIAAFWRGPGTIAGLLAIPWFATTGLVALSGLAGLRTPRSASAFVGNLARIDLGVAGGWLLLSRLGARPMGTQEPIVLLTAVHFHYAGFATALIAAAGARFSEGSGIRRRQWQILAVTVTCLPFVVALGFVLLPLLKVAAAVLFALCVMALAGFLWKQSAEFLLRTSRLFVRGACTFVLAGMILAGIYAVGDYAHREWLSIPRMASTHGWINGLGFVTLALLGWLVELRTGEHFSTALQKQETRFRVVVGCSRPNFAAREFHDF